MGLRELSEKEVDVVSRDVEFIDSLEWIIPFGQHQGETIGELLADPQRIGYVAWMHKRLDFIDLKYDILDVAENYLEPTIFEIRSGRPWDRGVLNILDES